MPEGREPPPRPAFTVLPRRWVVERTFAWLGQNRRMGKDYERLPETGEAVDSLMRLFRRFVSPSDPVSSPEHPF